MYTVLEYDPARHFFLIAKRDCFPTTNTQRAIEEESGAEGIRFAYASSVVKPCARATQVLQRECTVVSCVVSREMAFLKCVFLVQCIYRIHDFKGNLY